jgi:phosphoglycolate phosphatase-like HAD superfamily hydrolase
VTPIQAVIFDLDGTLAETHHMAMELFADAIVVAGGPHLEDHEIMAEFGRNEQGIFRDVVGDGWETAWDFYLSEYVDRHRAIGPFDGIVDVLDDLKTADLRLGVITAKTLITGNLSIEVLGLETYFDEVRGGGPDRVIKAEQISQLTELWGVDPASVVYVGDTPTDMTEARKAGVVPIAACWSEVVDREAMTATQPAVLFEEVEDLRAWLSDNY